MSHRSQYLIWRRCRYKRHAAYGLDDDLRAYVLARRAEIVKHTDSKESQEVLLAAHKLNNMVLKPIDGVAYQKLSPAADKQAAVVQSVNPQAVFSNSGLEEQTAQLVRSAGRPISSGKTRSHAFP